MKTDLFINMLFGLLMTLGFSTLFVYSFTKLVGDIPILLHAIWTYTICGYWATKFIIERKKCEKE